MNVIKEKIKILYKNVGNYFYWFKNFCLNNWFLILIIYFLILFYFYEKSLYNLYLRSLLFCSFYFFYKVLYKYCRKNELKLKDFFNKYKKINKVGIWIYKWTHIYFYWVILNNLLFDLLKKIRYIFLIKYNLPRVMNLIDIIYYFGFYLVIESFLECYINIYWEFKKKLFNYSYKDFFWGRLLMLSLSIFISFYLINFLFILDPNTREQITFEFYLVRLFIISHLIIFIKSLWILKKNFFLINNEIFAKNWILISHGIQGPGFFEKLLLTKILESRFLFSNVNFQEEVKLCNYTCHYLTNNKLIKKGKFDGKLMENRYWYRFELYKKDIFYNIDINKFNYLIYLLNITIFKYNFWKWHLDLLEKEIRTSSSTCLLEKVDVNKFKINPVNFTQQDDDTFIDYIHEYKNEKNIAIIKERLNVYNSFLEEFKKIFEWLDKEQIKFFLKLDQIYTEDFETAACYENIWIDYEIDINNFKFKNNKEFIIFDEKLKNFDNIIKNLEKDTKLNNNLKEFFFINTGSTGLYFFDIFELFSDFLEEGFDIEKIEIESEHVLNTLEQLKKIYSKEIHIKKQIQKFPKFIDKYFDV